MFVINIVVGISNLYVVTVNKYQGADKSLARTGRKHYSDQNLAFASHSKIIQKVVRPTRYLRQQ
jgi:hypothetical protein